MPPPIRPATWTAAGTKRILRLTFRSAPLPGADPVLLRDLTIENYRSFDKYRLDNLARVNLLVGDNNCGKTSVLEAVHIITANGKISCVTEALTLRECWTDKRRVRNGKEEDIPNVLALVHHNGTEVIADGKSSFSVTANGTYKQVEVTVKVEDSELVEIRSNALSDGEMFRLEIMRLDSSQFPRPPAPTSRPKIDTKRAMELRHIPNHVFVPSRGLGSARSAALWTTLLRSKKEALVERALSVVDDRIQHIIVTPNARARSGILFDRGDERVSAAEVGEGTVFMFSISVALAGSEGGVVLIDEIDTGLHYSKLADMWKMVIQSAKDLDVQVFATTHSLDCIRGLAEAVERDPAFTDDVAIFRIERPGEQAVRFGGDELRVVIENEIEVR